VSRRCVGGAGEWTVGLRRRQAFAASGRVLDKELHDERLAESERLAPTGRSCGFEALPPTHRTVIVGRCVGATAIALGLLMVTLIVHGGLN
jgi:hypothetical protein